MRDLAIFLSFNDPGREYQSMPQGMPEASNPSGFQKPQVFGTAAVVLLLAYTGPWPESEPSCSLDLSGWHNDVGIHLQHHMRALEFVTAEQLEEIGYRPYNRSQGKIGPSRPREWIYCHRHIEEHTLPNMTARFLKERRFSLAINTRTSTTMPNFIGFKIEDMRADGMMTEYSIDREHWVKADMKPGEYSKGICAFQVIVWQTLQVWYETWVGFLSELDSMVKVEVSQRRLSLFESTRMADIQIESSRTFLTPTSAES